MECVCDQPLLLIRFDGLLFSDGQGCEYLEIKVSACHCVPVRIREPLSWFVVVVV